MAITVLVPRLIDEIGIELTNFVISIKGSFYLRKEPGGNYMLEYLYCCYSTVEAYTLNKRPILNQIQVRTTMTTADVGGDIPTFIYSQLKAKYSLSDGEFIDC